MIIETMLCVAVLKATIIERVDWLAHDMGTYPEIVRYIVDNEAKKDSDHYYPCGDGDEHLTDPDGKPHRSKGIAQINDYWHPEVSEKEAHDPEFAIKFIINGLRKGKCHEWTTCRAFKKANPDHPYFGR